MGEAQKNTMRQRHIFKFEFFCMLVNFAKPKKIHCASAETCDMCANVRNFFFGARRFRKFADKNEIFKTVRATLPTSQILPSIRTGLSKLDDILSFIDFFLNIMQAKTSGLAPNAYNQKIIIKLSFLHSYANECSICDVRFV